MAHLVVSVCTSYRNPSNSKLLVEEINNNETYDTREMYVRGFWKVMKPHWDDNSIKAIVGGISRSNDVEEIKSFLKEHNFLVNVLQVSTPQEEPEVVRPALLAVTTLADDSPKIVYGSAPDHTSKVTLRYLSGFIDLMPQLNQDTLAVVRSFDTLPHDDEGVVQQEFLKLGFAVRLIYTDIVE